MTREIRIGPTHVPEPTKAWDYWVLWDHEVKQPLAPWENGHCYPSEWRQDGEVDPRTDYRQARSAANLGPEKLHDRYGFPEGQPESVGPTILLPHEGADTPGPEPQEPPVLFIDYDDVVDKSDNTVPVEVWATVEAIGGPTFVSRSFNDPEKETAGLHQLARGTPPGAMTCLPACLGLRRTRSH